METRRLGDAEKQTLPLSQSPPLPVFRDWQPIVSIEPAGEAECVCIQVAHPSQCYVTADGMVTHNTTVDAPKTTPWDAIRDEIATPAFKKWFGASKIVDSEGDPILVYHGGEVFDAFNTKPREFRVAKRGNAFALQENWGGSMGWQWHGSDFATKEEAEKEITRKVTVSPSYATDDPDVAASYADQFKKSEAEIKPMYLRMENPLDLRDPVAFEKWTGINLSGDVTPSMMAYNSHPMRSGGRVLQLAHDAGFDGVIFHDTDVRDRGLHTTYAFYDPAQVKMAPDAITSDGTFWGFNVRQERNSGAFSNEQSSILHSARRQADAQEELAQIAIEGQRRRENEELLKAGKLDPKVSEHGSFYRDYLGFVADYFSGRYDKLEFYAPGVRAAIENNQFEEAYAKAAINQMMKRVKDDLFASFGDPRWWSAQKARLNTFLDQLLPVAARLEVESVDLDGNYVFKPFEMRAGIIPTRAMRLHNFKPGQQIMWTNGRGQNESLTIGFKIPDREAHVLMRDMPADVQQQIYTDFVTQFPEGRAVLDQFIDPDRQDSVHTGPGNVTTGIFNRGALLKQFNEWPAELQALFGAEPLPGIHGIAGYTPDVAAQKTVAGAISTLLSRYVSGARKFKAGELRESGNVKNLLDGFSTRAMEAHREKIRMKTRRDILARATKSKADLNPAHLDHYVEVDQTFAKLYEAVVIAKKLPRDRYPALTSALNPDQRKLLVGLFGDLHKLHGRGLMIHKSVQRELMVSLALERTESTFLKVLEWFIDRTTKGMLGPASYAVNWTSNEILRLMLAVNRFNFAVVSALTLDPKAAKLGAYEFTHLIRGFLRDRFARWKKRITDVVPSELLADNSGIAFLEDPNDRSAVDELLRLDPGGAFLKGIGYGNIDTNAKLAIIYRMLSARASVAASATKVPWKNRKAWIADWMRSAHKDHVEDFRAAVREAMFWFMDYANVPSFIDPGQSVTQGQRVAKKLFLPFARWPYNMLRQNQKMTLGAIGQFFPGHTANERREAAAKLMTMAALTYLGFILVGAEDDEDDEPVIGTSVDDEGRVLDASVRTGNRTNVSRMARMVHEYAAQYGVDLPGEDYTVTGADGSEADIWLRYRNFPQLREMVVLGLAAKGNWGKMWEQSQEMAGEYVSFGLVTKLIPGVYQLSPFDRNKAYPYVATEALYDIIASPLAPKWARQLGVVLTDPVQRRSEKLESWDYKPGAWAAIMANTPGLSKNLPPAGQPRTAAFGPFDPKEWLSGQRYGITSDKRLTPEEKRVALQHLAEEYKTIEKLPFDKQHEILESFGFDMTAWDPKKTTTVNFAPDLMKLREMGLGKEAVRAVERKSINKRTGTTTLRPGIAYIPPQNLSVKSRRDELLRQITGLNIKRVTTGAVKKAMTKEEFFAPAK